MAVVWSVVAAAVLQLLIAEKGKSSVNACRVGDNHSAAAFREVFA